MPRFLLIALLASSATAFTVPKKSAAVVAAPRAQPLAKALELRGGISKEAFATTLIASNGLFGLQFLLIPKFFLGQFFDKTLDEFHMFFARFIGVLILGNCALLKVCPADISFPVAAVTQLAVALVGPYYAQFKLNPKMPMHLFPVIATTVTTALAVTCL